MKNCCIEGASGLADGYSLTEDNYEHLKLALKDMYGHPRLIQQSHAENILDLHSFETEGIKPFLTTLETSMRCLAEYGIDMENGAWIIVPIVQKLMPKELAQKWREEIHDDISFSTKKLIEFLHEKMLCYGSAQEQKADRKPKDTRPKTTLMLASTSMTACPCCGQNHRIYKCGKFLKMAPAERRNFAYRNRLCRRCLGPYSPEHLKKCEWKCKKCNDSHNHLLHTGQNEGQGSGRHNSQTHGSRKWQNPQSSRNGNPSKRPYQGQKVEGLKGNPAQAAIGGQREDTNAGGSAQDTVVNSLHSTTNHEKMAVLKNFKAVPKEKPNSTVRSLIDDGSQRTWIKMHTAKSLKLPVVRRELLAVATAFLSQPNTPRLYKIVKVSLRTKDNRFMEMEAVVSPDDKLVSDMPAIHFDPTKEYPHLDQICR